MGNGIDFCKCQQKEERVATLILEYDESNPQLDKKINEVFGEEKPKKKQEQKNQKNISKQKKTKKIQSLDSSGTINNNQSSTQIISQKDQPQKRGFGVYVFDSISDSDSEGEDRQKKLELVKQLPHQLRESAKDLSLQTIPSKFSIQPQPQVFTNFNSFQAIKSSSNNNPPPQIQITPAPHFHELQNQFQKEMQQLERIALKK